LSARAAWRLISLGFTRVYRYTPGKKDWIANGLPIEGEKALKKRVGDLVRLDVPVCGLSDRVGDVKERIQKAGWDSCVVVYEDRVVLGLLRPEALEVDPQEAAEMAMENGTKTFRLDASIENAMEYMQKMGPDSVLVTTSDGKLFGLLKREDVENELIDRKENA
jgi:signal-transduction protein with cAMP-binding, CBS, and nucleotidyltransferase domain